MFYITHNQHFPSPIEIRETSSPCGAILIDCLQADVTTAMAAVNVGPWIDRLMPSGVTRPKTEPVADVVASSQLPTTWPLSIVSLAVASILRLAEAHRMF